MEHPAHLEPASRWPVRETEQNLWPFDQRPKLNERKLSGFKLMNLNMMKKIKTETSRCRSCSASKPEPPSWNEQLLHFQHLAVCLVYNEDW